MIGFLKRWLPWIFAEYRAHIDVNAKCPACGHRKGSLKFVPTEKGASVEHTCSVCECKFYEETVRKADNSWLAQA